MWTSLQMQARARANLGLDNAGFSYNLSLRLNLTNLLHQGFKLYQDPWLINLHIKDSLFLHRQTENEPPSPSPMLHRAWTSFSTQGLSSNPQARESV